MSETAAAPSCFTYYPGNYRWSAEMLVILSAASFGGPDICEAERTVRPLRGRVGDDEAWFRAWCKGGDGLRARAMAAESAGHALTASSNYLRASFAYQSADHFRQPKDDDALAAYRDSLECFRKFAALTDRPRIEVVELPSEAGSFPAYFVHAENTTGGRNPCVVRFGGFDTQKEMQYMRGTTELTRRGFSVLLVDGPGQGEAIRFRGLHMRHDFEVAGSAALDYLATRGDIDMERVAILSMSLGGYYAPRCAAMDPRYRACIAWGAIWDYYATWQRRIASLEEAALPVPADHLLWACGVPTFEEALKKLEGFRLDGIAQRVECPFLLLHGSEDAQVPTADAQKLFDAVGSMDKTFRIFTPEEGGSQHCQRDNLALAVDVVCDWLEEKLK